MMPRLFLILSSLLTYLNNSFSSDPTFIPSEESTASPTIGPSIFSSDFPTKSPSYLSTESPSYLPTIPPSAVPSLAPTTITPSAVPSLAPTYCPSFTPAPTMKPTFEPSYKPSYKPTTPSSQPSSKPSRPSSQPSATPSKQPTLQPTNQPSTQPDSNPSIRPSSQPSYQPSYQPFMRPSGHPSYQPSIQPSPQPYSHPSVQPSCQPKSNPSVKPTRQPLLRPTETPTTQPSSQPSNQPKSHPTRQPSLQPSNKPSSQPSTHPSGKPSLQPISDPSSQPSTQPYTHPTRQPSSQPSIKPSLQPTTIPTIRPSSQPSKQPSVQPLYHPTNQPSCQPFSKPSEQPSNQPSNQPSSQPYSLPSSQPSLQPYFKPSAQPSVQPSSVPSIQPSAKPSSIPSLQPSNQPSSQPYSLPSSQPSLQPFFNPSTQPSIQPSSYPSLQPSIQPSLQPSIQPSVQPSDHPSSQPSDCPSTQPSEQPSIQPSEQPLSKPSNQPSTQPSEQPSVQPSSQPSSYPSEQPSTKPTRQPTNQPSIQPSEQPSQQPSGRPSSQPSVRPSFQPSNQPYSYPSEQPSSQPSVLPSYQPTTIPSSQPSSQPSLSPSLQPYSYPTAIPSNQPSMQPSSQPSNQPTTKPSIQPSMLPSCIPTSQPSYNPSTQPQLYPSSQPTLKPSIQPSIQPSYQPSTQPSEQPSAQPSKPTSQPSLIPTVQPSLNPTAQPSLIPTKQPSLSPSLQPSSQPSVQPSNSPMELYAYLLVACKNSNLMNKGAVILITMLVLSLLFTIVFLPYAYSLDLMKQKGISLYLLIYSKIFYPHTDRSDEYEFNQNIKIKNKSSRVDIISESLPKVMSEDSIFSKIYVELKKHHRWFFIYSRYCEYVSRPLRLFSLFSKVIFILFFVTLLFNYLEQFNDESCSSATNYYSCIQRKQYFFENDDRCKWKKQPKCGNCVNSYTFEIIILILIASSLLSTPIGVIFDWLIVNILSSKNNNDSERLIKEKSNQVNSLISFSSNRNSNVIVHDIENGAFSNSAKLSNQSLKLKPSLIGSDLLQLELLQYELVFHRSLLTEAERIIFDSAWNLNSQGLFMNQSFAKRIANRIRKVNKSVDKEYKNLFNLKNDHIIEKRLIFLLFCDLLNDMKGKVLRWIDSREYYRINLYTFRLRLFVWSVISVLDIAMIVYIIVSTWNEEYKQQIIWLYTFLLWILFDILFISTILVLITHIWFPLLIIDDVTNVKHYVLERFKYLKNSDGNQFFIATEQINPVEYIGNLSIPTDEILDNPVPDNLELLDDIFNNDKDEPLENNLEAIENPIDDINGNGNLIPANKDKTDDIHLSDKQDLNDMNKDQNSFPESYLSDEKIMSVFQFFPKEVSNNEEKDFSDALNKNLDNNCDEQLSEHIELLDNNKIIDEKSFNASEFLSVSHRLALHFTNLEIAVLVSSFRSIWPRYQIIKEKKNSFNLILNIISNILMPWPMFICDILIEILIIIIVGVILILLIRLYQIQIWSPFVIIALLLIIVYSIVILCIGRDRQNRVVISKKTNIHIDQPILNNNEIFNTENSSSDDVDKTSPVYDDSENVEVPVEKRLVLTKSKNASPNISKSAVVNFLNSFMKNSKNAVKEIVEDDQEIDKGINMYLESYDVDESDPNSEKSKIGELNKNFSTRSLKFIRESFFEASNELKRKEELDIIQRKHHLLNRFSQRVGTKSLIKDFKTQSDKLINELHTEQVKQKLLLKQRLEHKKSYKVVPIEDQSNPSEQIEIDSNNLKST